MTILEHLTPFTEKAPAEDIDLFVCEELDKARRYCIARYFTKGTMFPRDYTGDGKTPEERLLEDIFHEPKEDLFAPTTGFYHLVKKKCERNGKWVKSDINPLDASYIVINPEDLDCEG